MNKLHKGIQENKQLEETDISSKESEENTTKWLEKIYKSLKETWAKPQKNNWRRQIKLFKI